MKLLVLFASLLFSSAALAHTGVGETSGFMAGLEHPIRGPDHLLAMVAVGVWSGLALPSRPWGGAVVFVLSMLAGALWSFVGFDLPMVEELILASVIVFGLLVLTANPDMSRSLKGAALVAIGLFALMHGHAHASEAEGGIAEYIAGFAISTALLHIVGIGIARGVARSLPLQRTLGGAIAASGVALAFL